MRILVGAAVPPDPHSGAAGTVWQMNRAMERIGHEVVELWSDDIGRVIQHGNLYYTCELPIRYRRAVIKTCRSRNIDVVELNQPHAFLAFEKLAGSYPDIIRVNRSHGVELHVDEIVQHHCRRLNKHNRYGPRAIMSKLLQLRLRSHWLRTMRSVDGIVVSSSLDKEFLVERHRVHPEAVAVVRQGVPDSFLAVEPVSDSGLRRGLLYVGQAAFVKGPEELTKIATRLLMKHPNLKFTWVCHHGDHGRILADFPVEVHDRVVMCPWTDQDELISTFDQHQVFLFPSYFEGFGKAPLEAMARGLCVVASRVGGMRDYIESGRNGILVEPGDVSGFVGAVESLLEDSRSASEMSAAARQTACEYVWDRFARDVTAFYETLASLRTK